jgi:hypothetical protein
MRNSAVIKQFLREILLDLNQRERPAVCWSGLSSFDLLI